MTRTDRIRARLEEAFAPQRLVVEDDSRHHAGHAGAATGKGHFRVEIVAASFAGQSQLARHRLVYAALAPMMETDIHALSLQTWTPSEAAARELTAARKP